MKIISKNNDYYDSIIGFNDRVIYFRRKRVYTKKSRQVKKFIQLFRLPIGLKSFIFDINIIIFCGKPFLLFDLVSKNHTYMECYNLKEIDFFISSWCTKKERKKYCSMRSMIEKTFLNLENKDITIFHKKLKSPIIFFSFRNSRITLNPILKNIKFYKVISPFNAHKMIEEFIKGR